MGSKSKAPEYQAAKYDTGGLFGSSVTDKSGTTYNPESWMTKTMGTVGSYYNPTLKSLLSNDFTKDANFQAYQNQLNNDMTKLYDTSVLSNLSGRGLMRSSGLQGATNAFSDTLANNELNLYNNYRNNLLSNLSSLQGVGNTLYNYMTGVNSGSQAQAGNLNQYNLNKTQIDNANNNSGLFNTIANGIGSAASLAGGIASGNPALMLGGASGLANTLGSATGSMPSLQSSNNNSVLMNALLSATR